jgi:hypothetical protein
LRRSPTAGSDVRVSARDDLRAWAERGRRPPCRARPGNWPASAATADARVNAAPRDGGPAAVIAAAITASTAATAVIAPCHPRVDRARACLPAYGTLVMPANVAKKQDRFGH